MRFTLTKGRQQVALESSQCLLRRKRLLKRILHRWQNYNTNVLNNNTYWSFNNLLTVISSKTATHRLETSLYDNDYLTTIIFK